MRIQGDVILAFQIWRKYANLSPEDFIKLPLIMIVT